MRRLSYPGCLATLAALLAGCTSVHLTEPPQSATEQLLITRAVDDAVAKMDVSFVSGARIFVDTRFVDQQRDRNVLFARYMMSAVRDRLLRAGGLISDNRANADTIVEVRSGGQSVDHNSLFIGIPSISVPLTLLLPSFNPVTIPDLSLFKRDRQTGVAKLAVTAYRQSTGALAGSAGPVFGSSNHTETVVLLVIDMIDSDIEPKELQNRTH